MEKDGAVKGVGVCGLGKGKERGWGGGEESGCTLSFQPLKRTPENPRRVRWRELEETYEIIYICAMG